MRTDVSNVNYSTILVCTCRIQTHADGSDPEVSVVGGPFRGLNHWEGGVMGADGAMFCMPLNHDQVLRIRHLSSD